MNARYIAASTAAVALLAACAGSSNTSPAPAPAAAVTAASAPAASAAPRTFEYTPGTAQYRYIANAKVTQSMMGQSQDITTSSNRLVTVTIARVAADTLAITATIDSMTGVGPMGMPIMGLENLIGAKWGAKISPQGAFYSSSGPTEAENPTAAAMTDEMARTLPRINGKIGANSVWTDSIKDKVKQQGIELEREVVAKYTVVGDTVVAGEPSWKLSRDYTVKATGKGNTPQAGEVTLNTSGSGKGTLVISKKGQLLGGAGEESSLGQVTLTMNGMQVGLNSTTTTSFTKVK